MPSIVSNEKTGRALREALQREGFVLNPLVLSGDHGADIIAERGDERITIEVIGYKSNQPLRTRDFHHSVFQSLMHIGAGARRAAIAVPHQFEAGLPKRARNPGWVRIGEAFPELEIWLVDAAHASYRATKWNEWTLEATPTTDV